MTELSEVARSASSTVEPPMVRKLRTLAADRDWLAAHESPKDASTLVLSVGADAEEAAGGPDAKWIVATTFRSGDRAYYGNTRDGGNGLTPFPGNAHRYDTKADAVVDGLRNKERSVYGDFTVEVIKRARRTF